MEESFIELFIKRVKLESNFHKFLKEDLIYQFIDYFKKDYTKKQYSKNIENPLKIAIKFYKDYNIQYYEILLNGIRNGKININDTIKKSFVDTKNNKIFIRLSGNDSDVFVLVHEFAHFIDRNLNPTIIPDEYNFLCEVFPFYIEKQLEFWLSDKKFYDLIQIRRENRMYFESRMINAIESELFYESLYKESGQIEVEALDSVKIKSIMSYDYDLNIGLINYLLRYPLANVLSDYLISNQLVKNDADICKICLNTNLYEVLKSIKQEKFSK